MKYIYKDQSGNTLTRDEALENCSRKASQTIVSCKEGFASIDHILGIPIPIHVFDKNVHTILSTKNPGEALEMAELSAAGC